MGDTVETQQTLFNGKGWNRSRWQMLSAWQRAEYRGEYRHLRTATNLEPFQARGIINRCVSIATVYGKMAS
jgi:hypothetical protein